MNNRSQLDTQDRPSLNNPPTVKIDFGPNLGTTHIDNYGVKHFYVHITATVYNNNTGPINLTSSISEEYNFPNFCGDTNTYKVFLLNDQLTPDPATIYNSIVNGQHDFLNTPLENPYTLDMTLYEGQYKVITIGVLMKIPSNCAAVPRAIFSHENFELYTNCTHQINDTVSTDPQYVLGLKLEIYNKRKFIPPEDDCIVIPIGKIAFDNS